MRFSNRRFVSVALIIMVLFFALLIFEPCASAQSEENLSQEEADSLNYELLQLRVRYKEAERNNDALHEELMDLNGKIASAGEELRVLEQELSICQEAYNRSVHSLYKRGNITELEVLLDDREPEELWQDLGYYRRMMESEGQALNKLQDKLAEIEIRKRDATELRQKRARLAETLDLAALNKRISELETSLSEANARMRAMGDGVDPHQSAQEPSGCTPPPPGRPLDRIPAMPQLSDFELTGIAYSGYTTSVPSRKYGYAPRAPERRSRKARDRGVLAEYVARG